MIILMISLAKCDSKYHILCGIRFWASERIDKWKRNHKLDYNQIIKQSLYVLYMSNINKEIV